MLSFYLRVGNDMLYYEPRLTLAYGAAFTAVAAAVFLWTGLYRGIWRYASLPDLFRSAARGDPDHADLLPADVRCDAALKRCRARLVGINWLLLIGASGRAALRLSRCSRIAVSTICSSARAMCRSAGAGDRRARGADLFIRATRATPARVYRVVGRAVATRARGSGATSTACRFSARSTTSRRPLSRGSVGAATGRSSSSSPRRASTARRCAVCSTRADALGIPLARLPRAHRLGQETRRRRAARRSSRSRSRICSAGRRRCSTAPACAAGRRPAHPRHRRRRHHRRRAGAPDRGVRPGALVLLRQRRIRALLRSTARSRERFPRSRGAALLGDVRDRAPHRRGDGRGAAGARVPRRRAEACADGRGRTRSRAC